MRKTFDIKDQVVLNQLEKQPNQTQYIISLIKKDLESSKAMNREMIITIIEEYLSGKQILNKAKDNEVKSSVMGILNMLK